MKKKKQTSSKRIWNGGLAATRNRLHFANHPRAVMSMNRNLRFCKLKRRKRFLQEEVIHLLPHSPFPTTSKSPPVRSAISDGPLLDGRGISLTQSFMRLPMDSRSTISFRKVGLVRFIAVKSMGSGLLSSNINLWVLKGKRNSGLRLMFLAK